MSRVDDHLTAVGGSYKFSFWELHFGKLRIGNTARLDFLILFKGADATHADVGVRVILS